MPIPLGHVRLDKANFPYMSLQTLTCASRFLSSLQLPFFFSVPKQKMVNIVWQTIAHLSTAHRMPSAIVLAR